MLTAALATISADAPQTYEPLHVDLSKIENPTLLRLLAEVKNEEGAPIGAYDRAHNRHNR
jgi:hypothetical protein